MFTLRNDPELSEGFGVRPDNWEMSVGMQHELVPRVSVTALYYRRWFGNFVVTDNLEVVGADFDQYCITAPVDPRLPGGGGNRICGLFDVTPTKIGRVVNLRTLGNNYADQSENWNGVDLIVNARLQNNLLLQGGLSTGKTAVDNCALWLHHPDVAGASSLQGSDSLAPGAAGRVGDFCHQETPFLSQVKFLGAYPLPWWGLQVSGAFQSIPGSPIWANYVATNAVIRPSLGRDLSAGSPANVTVNIIPPGTMYLDRINQLDVRATKVFQVGAARIMGMVDFYNALNANTVLTANSSYGTTGTSWLVPQALKNLERYKVGPLFNPNIAGSVDGLLGAINFGSTVGGSNWPGGGYDPETHTVYVQANNSAVGAVSLAPPPTTKEPARKSAQCGCPHPRADRR